MYAKRRLGEAFLFSWGKEPAFSQRVYEMTGTLQRLLSAEERKRAVKRIQESAENYLETILILHERKGSVRSIDIAAEMEFSKPSVSVAMKHLREKGHITVSADGLISLTAEGRRIAEGVYERHLLFTRWLSSLGVPQAVAEEDACRIEHVISEETFRAIRRHVDGPN